MSATNQFEQDLLDLIFTNVAAPNVGDVAGLLPSAAPTSVQVSLHTAAMAETDTTPVTNEAAYTGYGRELVARSAAGWTVASPGGVGTVDNDALITFGTSTTSETETDFGLTLMSTGVFLQIYGALTASLAVSNGVTPEFAIQALAITLD